MYLSIYLSIYLSNIYLYSYLSIYLSINLSIDLSGKCLMLEMKKRKNFVKFENVGNEMSKRRGNPKISKIDIPTKSFQLNLSKSYFKILLQVVKPCLLRTP